LSYASLLRNDADYRRRASTRQRPRPRGWPLFRSSG